MPTSRTRPSVTQPAAPRACDAVLNLHPQTRDLLTSYSFPGNVRELLNILERACLLSDGTTILPEHLPADVTRVRESRDLPSPTGQLVSLEEAEQRYLQWAAKSFKGSKRELAEHLGVSERTLYRKLSDDGDGQS